MIFLSLTFFSASLDVFHGFILFFSFLLFFFNLNGRMDSYSYSDIWWCWILNKSTWGAMPNSLRRVGTGLSPKVWTPTYWGQYLSFSAEGQISSNKETTPLQLRWGDLNLDNFISKTKNASWTMRFLAIITYCIMC